MVSSSPPRPGLQGDLARQAAVAVSAVVAVVGTAIGVGAFGGTPIAEAGDGALSADGTLVAPAGPAFAIWTPIYAGLVGYAVWQALPRHRTDGRQRRLGWLIAATMLLNAAWILTVQAGRITASVAVIAVLLGALIATYARVVDTRSAGWVEGLLVDATMGLYLGWVTIATVANVAAALVHDGAGGLRLGATTWAVLILLVATVIGASVAAWSRGRLSYGAALGWGLIWVSVGRLDGGLDNTVVSTAAALAAAAVLAVTITVRLSPRRPRWPSPR